MVQYIWLDLIFKTIFLVRIRKNESFVTVVRIFTVKGDIHRLKNHVISLSKYKYKMILITNNNNSNCMILFIKNHLSIKKKNICIFSNRCLKIISIKTTSYFFQLILCFIFTFFSTLNKFLIHLVLKNGWNINVKSLL